MIRGSLRRSSPLSYRLISSTLERLVLLHELPSIPSSLPSYTTFDPDSRPQSDYHDLLIRFLVDVGTVKLSDKRDVEGNSTASMKDDFPLQLLQSQSELHHCEENVCSASQLM